MPRIRNIKPEFWDSPSTARADLAVRLTFIAMWNWADDSGHGTANLKELEAFCFPNDDVQDLPRRGSGDSSRNSGAVWPNFAEVLHEVAETYGVIFYTVKGRNYYEIPSFKDHQAKHFRAQSKHPSASEGQIVDIRSGNVIEPEDHDRAVPEVRAQEAEDREQGAEKILLDRDDFGDGDPEPQSLDDLAARYADELDQHPDAYGTIDDPRCAKHKDLDRAPKCWDCKKAGDVLKTRAEEEKQARLDAINACTLCDDNGMRQVPGGLTRCTHQPHEEDTPPWEKHA